MDYPLLRAVIIFLVMHFLSLSISSHALCHVCPCMSTNVTVAVPMREPPQLNLQSPSTWDRLLTGSAAMVKDSRRVCCFEGCATGLQVTFGAEACGLLGSPQAPDGSRCVPCAGAPGSVEGRPLPQFQPKRADPRGPLAQAPRQRDALPERVGRRCPLAPAGKLSRPGGSIPTRRAKQQRANAPFHRARALCALRQSTEQTWPSWQS